MSFWKRLLDAHEPQPGEATARPLGARHHLLTRAPPAPDTGAAERFFDSAAPTEGVKEAIRRAMLDDCESTTQLIRALAEAHDANGDPDGAARLEQFALEFAGHEASL